jgi:RNA polymerase sigma-70 factor (ECF subfamily)
MSVSEDSSTQLQVWIERLQAGDATARDEILNHTCKRLRRITRKMLRDFSRVRRWEDTDDVLQNALLRLLRALDAVPIASAQEFFRVATLQIRRELLDLARRYSGPQDVQCRRSPTAGSDAAARAPASPLERPTTTHEPNRLAAWTEFHARVAELPTEQREIFDLLWYQGLTRGEAAALLGLSESTVKRRWLAARVELQKALASCELSW